MCFQSETLRAPVSELFLKKWKKYTERRRPLEGPCLDDLRKKDTKPWTDDPIQLFMQDYDDPMPRTEISDVLEFCKQMLTQELNETTQGLRAAAWLHDSCARPRDSSQTPQDSQRKAENTAFESISQSGPLEVEPPRIFRRYEGYLTAYTLLLHLLEKRFDHESLPDADRRLIHITDLDPQYILALALSAPKHQVLALRNAICKYVTLQTSLKITPGSYGYSVFQLELHFSFFALRRGCEPDYASSGKVRPHRKWTDLSSITGFASGIHEAQTSFHVCGSDGVRWIGYSFLDTHFDEDRDGEMGEDEFSYEEFMADQTANDGDHDANKPIWDPREQFLEVLRVRIDQVVKEWRNLIRAVDNGIKQYTDEQSARSTSPDRNQNEDIMQAFKWTNNTLSILSKLKESLRVTNNAWKGFSAPDGDINYFLDMEPASEKAAEHIHCSRLEIKRLFEELNDSETTLELLVDRCDNFVRSAKDLNLQLQALQCQSMRENLQLQTLQCQKMQENLQLMLENNHTVQKNGTAADFNILGVSPLPVVSALFQTSDDILPFDKNTLSFVISTVVLTIVYWLLLMLARIWQPWQTRLWTRLKDIPLRTEGMAKSAKGVSKKNFLRKQNRQADSVNSADTDLINAAVNVKPIPGFHEIERPAPNRSSTWAP